MAARPLREQLILATLVMLLPLATMLAWAGSVTYRKQVAQVGIEATAMATLIAAHIDESKPAGEADVSPFLQRLRLPDPGTSITILDRSRDGKVIAVKKGAPGYVEEAVTGRAEATGRPWTVVVGIPASQAWWRTEDSYQRALLLAAIATVLMLIAEAFFVRRWTSALHKFEKTADRVGAGDLRTPPREPMPLLELEHLRDAFIGMVDNLREAREAIARQVEEERQMREELQSLQQQIIRQERLAAIGVLLSGIAHELNNPLQSISGFADLLQRDPEVKPAAHADLALIKKESMRASAIIRNLSRFSRQQGTDPASVYLRDVVASVVELRQRRFHEQGITLTVDDTSIDPTRAVFTELQQVLLNFVINAEQSLLETHAADKRMFIRTLDVEDRVRLEVEDTGPGVPPQHEGKLFQPFFTTKPMGEGTGLGLSVSYGIVRSFNGTIGYRRGTAGGALFYFELPKGEGVRRIYA